MSTDPTAEHPHLPADARELTTLLAAIRVYAPLARMEQRWFPVAAALTLTFIGLGWAVGWIHHPLTTGFLVYGVVHMAGMPMWALAHRVPLRAFAALMTMGPGQPSAAYGFWVWAAVRDGRPFQGFERVDGTASGWLGWALPNALSAALLVHQALGVWAVGLRFYDLRRLAMGTDSAGLFTRYYALTRAVSAAGAPPRPR